MDHTIDYSFISHVHRNKQKQRKEGDTRPPPPPSITVQLVRSYDVDQLFYNKKKFREIHGAKKINIFHAMSRSTSSEKEAIELCNEVSWCDYRGHSKLFVVKMVNGDFHKGVLDLTDLESKAGALTQPEADS